MPNNSSPSGRGTKSVLECALSEKYCAWTTVLYGPQTDFTSVGSSNVSPSKSRSVDLKPNVLCPRLVSKGKLATLADTESADYSPNSQGSGAVSPYSSYFCRETEEVTT